MKVIWYMEASDEKIEPHFKAKEFQCKDKTEELLVAADLMDILEKIRNHFNAPVIINSGYRTPSWNSKVNGAPNSYHCKGMATIGAQLGSNTRSAGSEDQYALIPVTWNLIQWANFIVFVEQKNYDEVLEKFSENEIAIGTIKEKARVW